MKKINLFIIAGLLIWLGWLFEVSLVSVFGWIAVGALILIMLYELDVFWFLFQHPNIALIILGVLCGLLTFIDGLQCMLYPGGLFFLLGLLFSFKSK